MRPAAHGPLGHGHARRKAGQLYLMREIGVGEAGSRNHPLIVRRAAGRGAQASETVKRPGRDPACSPQERDGKAR